MRGSMKYEGISGISHDSRENQVLRRIGVVGDIHGESQFLETTLTFVETADVDLVLSVGDIVDGGGDVDRCCKLLIGCGVPMVRGNHDRWLFEAIMRDSPDATQHIELSSQARSFLASLPKTRVFKTQPGGCCSVTVLVNMTWGVFTLATLTMRLKPTQNYACS